MLMTSCDYSFWKFLEAKRQTKEQSALHSKYFLNTYAENIRNITQNSRLPCRKTQNCHSKVFCQLTTCHAGAAINLTLKQLDSTSTRVINEQGTCIYSHFKHLLQLNLSQTQCSNHKLFHRQIALKQKLPILLWMQCENIFATWTLFH